MSEDQTQTSENPEEEDESENRMTRSEHIPEFTKQELQAAIEKSGDTKGIKAEDIKESDDETKEMMREIFNEVIRQESDS